RTGSTAAEGHARVIAIVDALTSHNRELHLSLARVYNAWGDQLVKKALQDYDRRRERHRGESRSIALQARERYSQVLEQIEKMERLAFFRPTQAVEYQRVRALLGLGGIDSLDH